MIDTIENSVEHPRKTAARLSNSPRLTARETGLTTNEVRTIRDLQYARAEVRSFTDPLILARTTRRFRTKTAVAAAAAREAAWVAEQEADRDRWEKAAEKARGIRKSLFTAARIARKMGLDVRKSTNRAGRVSSYYCSAETGETFRLSDHEIPWTPARSAQAELYGRFCYQGFNGTEIIIDKPQSKTRLRRRILLAAAGR